MSEDPFGTDGIRRRVLAGWSASAARFREDANAEEDLALGGYRDRLVVELAQNAADAARRAGVPGRLLLAVRELDGQALLVAANTGAALDAAGVQALATLRASAKRDGEDVGRFGVGFAAVLAVTDEPAVLCRSGGVRFGAGDTRQLVQEAAEESPELAAELTRRDGHVPVLRLPFPAEGTPPDGYDTAVLLPLRDAAAEDLAIRLLDDVGDPLLLALPGLESITVELPARPARTTGDVDARWHVLRRGGSLDPQLLADRPTEERRRIGWDLAWALPRPGTPPPSGRDAVVHAPTPTDEPLPWPALLIAGLPLDPSRRHVAAGPATDALVERAAEVYIDLLTERAGVGADAWSLLPVGLAAGALDGALRAALMRRVPAAAILPSAEDPTVLLRPREAVILQRPWGSDREVVSGLASWISGLVRVPSSGPPLVASGAREMSLTDVVEALPPVEDPPRWRATYGVLEPLAADPLAREALAAVPVPLADGRIVRGARGLVLLDAEAGHAAALSLLGVRTVDPAASHPLLERLGAVRSAAREVLELPAVHAAVMHSADADDPDDVAAAVLLLVHAAVDAGQLDPGGLPWLGNLAVSDDEGELTPAAALAIPGTDAARWFDRSEIGLVPADLVRRWGEPVLAATGMLTGATLLRASDVVLDGPSAPASDAPGDSADPSAELEGWDDWCALAFDAVAAGGLEPSGAVLTELLAVRDLDVVREAALPEVVAAIAGDAVLRQALTVNARVSAEGRLVELLPYTAWWLRSWLGAPMTAVAERDGSSLSGLLPRAPDWLTHLDPEVQQALGVIDDVGQVGAADVAGVLDRLADPSLQVAPALFVLLIRRCAELAAAGLEVTPPSSVRGLADGQTRVVLSSVAAVLDGPMHAQVLQARPDLAAAVLPVPSSLAPALADLLDLPLAGELVPDHIDEHVGGVRVDVPPAALAVLPGAPATWCEHDVLTVAGTEVEWWVDGSAPQPGHDAIVHAVTLDGLARGLAWAVGRWESRAAVAQVLVEPSSLASVLMDDSFTE